MTTTTLTPLKWRTVTNGSHIQATTHFGTVYDIVKAGEANDWVATVTVPQAGEEALRSGASFVGARRAAIDDYIANGGR
jgi:hypothetical protein